MVSPVCALVALPDHGQVSSVGGGIALFDQTGNQIRFIDTGCDYWPTQVAFAPDHSLWAIGSLPNSELEFLTADYLFLRHYSRDGEELGRYLPRSSFPHPDNIPKEPLIAPMVGLWELRVTSDRVTALLQGSRLWVETDLNGKEIERWNTGPNRPNAITTDGDAWQMQNKQLEVFDRAAGIWKAVPFNSPDGRLIGAQGSDLIFLLRGQDTIRRIAAPTASADFVVQKSVAN